jgi:hypothetical protein
VIVQIKAETTRLNYQLTQISTGAVLLTLFHVHFTGTCDFPGGNYCGDYQIIQQNNPQLCKV